MSVIDLILLFVFLVVFYVGVRVGWALRSKHTTWQSVKDSFKSKAKDKVDKL